MTTADDALAAALELWLDRVLAGEIVDPAGFAAAHGVPVAEFVPRADQARWLVGRHQLARAQTAAVPTPPFQLDDLDVQQEAGRGGMGIVFRAVQHSLGRTVAVKVMQPSLLDGERARTRFLREARACARLHHPNVVQVILVGEQDSLCYYAMEWIEGASLATILQQRRQAGLHCSAAYAVESGVLLAKVARALQHAHDHGLLHRDVKPTNILVDAQGEPHLADFGLVKDQTEVTLTGTGEVVGSEPYMSPEQCVGRRLDERSDVYSLGVTLYECLTLTLPFAGSRIETLRRRILEGRLQPLRRLDPGVPEQLQWICQQACAREPGQRHASAAALAADLEAFARGGEVLARPPSAWLQLKRVTWRMRRLGAALGLACVFAAMLWVVLGLVERTANAELRSLHSRVLDLRLAGDTAKLQQVIALGLARFPADASLQLAALCAALDEGGTDAARRTIDGAEALLTRADHRAVVAAGRAAADWLDGDELGSDADAALAALGRLRSDAETMLAAGHLLLLVRRFPEAIEILRRVPGADVRVRALALAAFAQACKRMGRTVDARAAIAAFAMLYDAPRSLYELVQIGFAAGQTEQARSDLALLQERHPDSAFCVAAQLLLEAGAIESQLDGLVQRARAAPDWPQVAPILGPAVFAAHQRAGRVDRALEVIEAVVRDRPDSPDLHALLGTTLHQAGRHEAGVAELLTAAKLGDRLPTDRDAHWATYHFFRGDLPQALQHYRASSRLAPTDVQRLRPLGVALQLWAQQAEGDARVSLLRECLAVRDSEAKVAPRSRRAQQLLAEVLAELAAALPEQSEEAAALALRGREIEAGLRPH